MPVAKLSKSEWAEVKAMAELGHPDDFLAQEFNVSEGAIRKRRYDDKKRGEPWQTPKELEKAEAIKAIEHFYNSKPNGAQSSPVNLAPVTDEEIAEIRSMTPKQIASHCRGLLLQGLQFLKVPATLDDFNKLHNIFMKAAGLDKAPVGVAINLGGMAWSSSSEGKEKPIVVVSP